MDKDLEELVIQFEEVERVLRSMKNVKSKEYKRAVKKQRELLYKIFVINAKYVKSSA